MDCYSVGYFNRGAGETCFCAYFGEWKEMSEETFAQLALMQSLRRQLDDDTALKAARKAERERCADIAESYTGKQGEHDGTAIANIIRELGDE